MCRMVGTVFLDICPTRILEELRSVSRNGHIPGLSTPGHRDGWGIATCIEGRCNYLGRSPAWAAEDESYGTALKEASGLRGPGMLIGHVRAASRGVPKLVNTHPFIIDNLVFAHNGTIKRFSPETSREPVGGTDSEKLALILADRYARDQDLRAAMKSAIRDEVLGREFTGAVFLASDGRTMSGYRNYSKNGRYYDLRLAEKKDSVTLFQESSNGMEGTISQIDRGELVSIGIDLDVRRERVL